MNHLLTVRTTKTMKVQISSADSHPVSLPFRAEITFVALALLQLSFRFTLHILGDRLAHIDLVFREPALIVWTDKALITYSGSPDSVTGSA